MYMYVQVTDGVLTNDSDAFLYGANTVYRDLTTSERVRCMHMYMYTYGCYYIYIHVCMLQNAQVECYDMKEIHDVLGKYCTYMYSCAFTIIIIILHIYVHVY